jgi:hypothetical protein
MAVHAGQATETAGFICLAAASMLALSEKSSLVSDETHNLEIRHVRPPSPHRITSWRRGGPSNTQRRYLSVYQSGADY